jgi:signal transduction histidine kinase
LKPYCALVDHTEGIMLAGGREHSVFHTLDLGPALKLALALERAPMGLIMLKDELSSHLYPAVAEGLTPQQREEFGFHRPGAGPVGIAFSEARHVEMDATADEAKELRDCAASLGFSYVLAVPLAPDNGAPLGVLVLLFKRKRHPGKEPHLPLFARFVGAALDNARKHHDAERARERAEVHSQSKTQFFARMSHELRTPLQSIIGYIDLLRLGIPEPMPLKDLELLEKAARSGEVLLSVIDDLITFSRAEVGRIEYHLDRVSVDDAITAAENVVSPIARHRGVELKAAHDVHQYVLADATKLKQILINLLTNAVKFTPSGGSVQLGCGRSGGWVSFSVKDVGPGIAQDKLQKVFEPFVQLGVPAVDSLGGSGLGLPISREFASAMGGDIAVESNPGQGSTFTLRLRSKAEPRHRAPRAPVATREARTPPRAV